MGGITAFRTMIRGQPTPEENVADHVKVDARTFSEYIRRSYEK
jgi:hypothetical protein